MNFKSLDLNQWIILGLEKKHFTTPTDIQIESYKLINQNNNVIISAPTGSGKTYTYLLPILNKIDPAIKSLQALIIVPTKELASQVHSEFKFFCQFNKDIKIALINSSDKLSQNNLNQSNQIIIATVFKVKQLINDKLDTKNLKTIVLDEADMLVDYGFYADLDYIMQKIEQPYLQKIVLSASINANLANQFKKFIKNAKIVMDKDDNWAHQQIKHYVVYQKSNTDPIDTFKKLLLQINPYFAIIFATSKKIASELYEIMLSQKLNVALLHKDLSTRERKNIFLKIKNNEFKYLVATDLVSRGIDIDGVSDVISFDLAKDDIWYLHRSGRTGRQNYNGSSYVIYTSNIDNQLNHLSKKGIEWQYLLIDQDTMVNKPKKLHLKKNVVDINSQLKISKLYNSKSTRVKPGYKKKLKKQISKINQKAKREYIDKKMKKMANIKAKANSNNY